MNWNQQSLIPQPGVYHVWSLLLPVVQPKICWLWDKASCRSHRGTKPEAGLYSIPWLLSAWSYLAIRLLVSSFSCPACAAAMQICWPSIKWKCRFDRYVVFHICWSSPCPVLLCSCVCFLTSIFCSKPISLLLCSLSLAQHSHIDKYMDSNTHLQPDGIPFQKNLITSCWNQLPKEASKSLNSDISKYENSCLGDGT